MSRGPESRMVMQLKKALSESGSVIKIAQKFMVGVPDLLFCRSETKWIFLEAKCDMNDRPTIKLGITDAQMTFMVNWPGLSFIVSKVKIKGKTHWGLHNIEGLNFKMSREEYLNSIINESDTSLKGLILEILHQMELLGQHV